MEISTQKKYTLVTATENTFSDFFNAFTNEKLNQENKHTIIQLSENLNTTIENLFLFLDVTKAYKKNNMSFVVICNKVDVDEIPEELNVVPTITEAEDVLEMEEIERDLGF